MTRGPDYADQLTESQQRTLDQLRRRVSDASRDTRPPQILVDAPERPRRRTLVGVASVALAVAAVALATAAVAAPRHRPFAPAATATASPSTQDILRALGDASRFHGPSVALTQASVVVVAVRKSDLCVTFGYEVTTTLSAAPTPSGRGSLPDVRLDVSRATVPSGAVAWLDCGGQSAAGAPEHLFAGSSGTTGVGWTGLLAKLRGSGPLLPDLPDPRAIPDGVSVSDLVPDTAKLAPLIQKAAASAGSWWAAVAQLLGSPLCGPAVRSSALLLAAQPGPAGQASLESYRSSDILGRPGVTLRVPYQFGGEATYADLTFDPASGALRQRAVAAPPGHGWTMVVTAYR